MHQWRIEPQPKAMEAQGSVSNNALALRTSVVKVGGAVLTRKAEYKAIDREGIAMLARLIACDQDMGGGTVFLAGGGSFGNAAAHGRFDPARETVRSIVSEWRAILASELAGLSVEADVITARSMWQGSEGERFDPAAILSARSVGRSIVLLGDLLHRSGRSDRLLSSDLLALLVTRHIATDRVVMVTDCAAVLDRAGRPIARFPTHPAYRLETDGRSKSPDSTGGMALKVSIMQKIAREGSEGWICGREALRDPVSILRGTPSVGTRFERDQERVPC
jgi:isopentenyl phosphate kinase